MMLASLATASISLDVGTLFVIATCLTSLLGLLLLFAWLQDRIPALAWWGAAYLIGGFSGTIWRFGDVVSPPLPPGIVNVLLFVAVGMIWSAARLFHGRPVLWGAMLFGAVAWLAACMLPGFASSPAARVVLSALIVASYTFLTAAELWLERRKSLIRRWPAVVVPMLHGAIFLFPVALATLSSSGPGERSLAAGWIAVFAIEIVLYVVGTAFIVLTLAKDRTVRLYKTAAATDPLTTLLNRRGFFEAAGALMAANKNSHAPVSLVAFDLDRFKAINDELGHAAGDAVLRLFASVLQKTLRASDVIGRLGGEEFVALLPGTLGEAAIAAGRVRANFAAAKTTSEGVELSATVSAGVACGSPHAALEMLVSRADTALYRAKLNGRNRVETAAEAVGAAPGTQAAAVMAGPAKKAGADRAGAHQVASRARRREDAYAGT